MKITQRSPCQLIIYQNLSNAELEPIEFVNIILFLILLLDAYEAITISDYYITFLHIPITLMLWLHLMRRRFREITCTIDKVSKSISIREQGIYLLEREFKFYSLKNISQLKRIQIVIINNYFKIYKIRFLTDIAPFQLAQEELKPLKITSSTDDR